MITVNSNENDFGDIMILALRYALGRRTYVTYEVSDFIKKNENLINERVCLCMIKDIDNYLILRNNELINDDKCDYDSWINLDKWLYELARKRDFNLIGVEDKLWKIKK